MVKNSLSWLKLIALSIILASLAACAGKPSTKPSTPSKEQQIERKKYANPRVEAQVNQLELAVKLNQQQQHAASLEILTELDTQLLPAEYFWLALETSATSSLAQGNGWQTLRLLEKFSQGQQKLTKAQYFKLFDFRANALSLTGNYPAALQARFNQAEAASNQQEKAAAYASLWQTLMLLDLPSLTSLYNQASQADAKGWYELALVRQSLMQNPDTFNPRWQAWQQKWPQHSAQKFMPPEMPQLAQLTGIKITHIGVFLPQEGSLKAPAKAIQNALVAAQINAFSLGVAAPKISFFNSQGKSLDQLYQEAQAAQVQVVIGPLAKAQVTQLEQRSQLPLPTLALNYGNSAYSTNPNLFQLGLSAEHEAEELAKKAWQSGFRHALVLTPEDSWGKRVEQSFIKEWRKLGGQIDLTRQYGKRLTLDKSLRELLEVELSQQRHQQLTRTLGQRPYFTPHSREDSDFLFIHASPANARQIMPALKFLMAGDLPVLATSSINSGQVNVNLDKDMNGLMFCDIPWYVNSDLLLLEEIKAAWPGDIQNFGRLYALGKDAYFLAQRLHLLTAIPNASFAGATGQLSQNKGIFKRQLAWAEFKQGRVVPLPAASLEEKFLAPSF